MSEVADVERAAGLATVEPKAGGLSFPDYVQIIAGAKDLPDSEVDAAMIMARIMASDSLDAGLGDSKAEGLGNYVGETIVVHNFQLNQSDEKFKGQGSPVYAVIDATVVATGEKVVLTTGSTGVLAALGLILKLDTWDERFVVKKVPTPNGDALKLVFQPSGATVAASGEDKAY